MRKFLKKIFARDSQESRAWTLVKSRPRTLTEPYQPAVQGDLCDEYFHRLRRKIYGELDRSGLVVHRESGKLASGRPYFYIKPFNAPGLLFERSGSGWIIARAEKVTAMDTFTRDVTVWDAARVLVPRDPGKLPRISSPLCGDDMIPVALYEERLLTQLGIKKGESSKGGVAGGDRV